MTDDATRPVSSSSAGPGLLFVFDGDTSKVVKLPQSGELVVGRSSECGLRVQDQGASRAHARFDVKGPVVTVTDLGSQNGTRVNGHRLMSPRVLAPGDTVTLSDVVMVLRGSPEVAQAPAVLGFPLLLARLEEEAARSLKYDRALCVIVVDTTLPRLDLELKLEGIACTAWHSDLQLVAVLPEVEGPEALAATEGLMQTVCAIDEKARAGFAVFPNDGVDAASLLLAARSAAATAEPGQFVGAEASVRTLAFGERTAVVADPSLLRVYDLLARLAKSTLPVLVLGETGSGKEHAAYAVHHGSKRAAGPFVTLNCAAIAETLIESELFGDEMAPSPEAAARRSACSSRATAALSFSTRSQSSHWVPRPSCCACSRPARCCASAA